MEVSQLGRYMYNAGIDLIKANIQCIEVYVIYKLKEYSGF